MMNEQPRNVPNRQRVIGIIGGIALIFGGLIGGAAIPVIMTQGDKGAGGMLYFLIGLPIGFCVALLFVALGIVVIVKASKLRAESPTPEAVATGVSEANPTRKPGWVKGLVFIVLGVVGGLTISWLFSNDMGEAGFVLFFLIGVPLGFFFAVIFVTLGIVMLVRARR
jgi:MFS family permease